MYQSRHKFALVPFYSETVGSLKSEVSYVFAISGIETVLDSDRRMQQIMVPSCEAWDTETREWIQTASLDQPRADAGACAFAGKYVYVFGGWAWVERKGRERRRYGSISAADSLMGNRE